MKLITLLLLVVLAALVSSAPAPREQVGPLPDGGFLLNSGWRIQAAGQQVRVDTFPLASALSPDGRYLLVLNCGYNIPSISVIDTASAREIGRTQVADAWLGLAFTPKGDRVYVGGGSKAAVFEFTFSNGALTPARTFSILPKDAKPTNRDFVGDVALSPDGRLIYAADLYHDSLLVINPQSGMVIEHYKTGRRPYRILFHPDGKSFFVTHWTDGTLGKYDAQSGEQLLSVRVGPHPTDMVWRAGKAENAGEESGYVARLFVAASNTNSVYTFGVNEAAELTPIESINVAMTPRQPLGMTPSALALSPDGKSLYVVCSDANALAAVDVTMARSHVTGFLPTGWYPTGVRTLRDGRITVLNGRGLRSYANAKNGPNPTKSPEPTHEGIPASQYPGYVAHIQTGTVSFVDPPNEKTLEAGTRQVLANSPYRDEKLDTASTLPPIEHVIYIVKENRTYDQVLGDMKEGNGDPSLVIFGEQITPNLHKLAREFVLLDNFYVNSDVSADGHNWSTAAIAPDYVQKLWPNSYAGRRKLYDYEGQEPTALPPAGYIWTAAAQAGVSMRNFGYFVNNKPLPVTGDIHAASVRDPILAKVTNPRYRAFDLNYPDVERAKVFLAELAEYEKAGQMPRFMIMRLGNDHTSGTAAGRIAPLSAAADNDYALGMIVEGVSHSPFWGKTAIFVLEDDAQNGPDHVDSHRSPAFVISGYARRHFVDGTMYNTTSMLRTIELILGLRPMTTYDAGARPMTGSFQTAVNPAPYTAEKPRVPLDERNPSSSPTAGRSAQMDFSEADRNDDDELNDILWRAIRGTEPPAPVRSYFSR
jgi:YVTN family beta-propeller protein